eukprot:1140738-Pelagomonas_calceolata.AAC.3
MPQQPRITLNVTWLSQTRSPTTIQPQAQALGETGLVTHQEDHSLPDPIFLHLHLPSDTMCAGSNRAPVAAPPAAATPLCVALQRPPMPPKVSASTCTPKTHNLFQVHKCSAHMFPKVSAYAP